jgi:hypothetical protein
MPIEIITTVEDRSGTKATTSVKVLDASTIAQLLAFAPLWATALNNLIFGKIISMVADVLGSTIGITGNAGTINSDVEHIGKFQFRTVSGTRVNVNIPALDEAAVSAYSSDTLDQANTEVAAFIAAMETGIVTAGGNIAPCDIGELSIIDTVLAHEAFKNSGARR